MSKQFADQPSPTEILGEQRPPALCPECQSIATFLFGGFVCTSKKCDWVGLLTASCDCCDRPMEPTAPIEAYGIETYACDACRNVEY